MTGRELAHDDASMAMFPNLRHLRLLDVAISESSLTAAARKVHISQPAASQAIAKLAEVFGARLIERSGNNVAPTPEGEIVVKRARRALDHLRATGPGLKGRKPTDRAQAGDLLVRYASTSQLRAVSAFATTGSFAAAARKLGQAESSVQRACRDIERIIGQPLLEGGQRKRVLTASGQRLAEQASLALNEVTLARAELRERAGVFDSHLVIGALPLARTQLVPRAIVQLMARYPAARIEIVDGAYDALVQQMRLGACDFIIGALRGRDRAKGLQERALFKDLLCIVARAGHPLAGRRVQGAELARFPWILPRRDAPARHVFERLSSLHGLEDPARGHVETGSLVVVRGLLMESDALTLISLSQIDYEYTQGLLAPLDFPLDDAQRVIGVTLLDSSLPNSLQRTFLEFLEDSSASIVSGKPPQLAQGL
ncbi:LysR family transcriptional regulator [Roseinatronobacter alkalisoli]|uniref:LysR family transcriptional regulator n=1 Tax=Roseinatronobacter alkalisoli TaxID=3028235 RepID=A0ABT5TAB2_9RHOB|nr:LysR family transcriptional regulator [Roseinatronobacter sp. HJB301]MDD7972053.1 LysR family transcriptional regulator [Roseinatronobacter sp. HJB301]